MEQEDLIFPGVEGGIISDRHALRGYRTTQVTHRGIVPTVTEGMRRIWRASSISNPHGMWADKPLTSYGNRMMYMDLPHEVAEQHRAGESKAQHYAFYDRTAPLPGHVNHIQFRDTKPYELSDWDEYSERWG